MSAGHSEEANGIDHSKDERYVAGLTAPELRDILNPTVVQSLRENSIWRQPDRVALLYALDLIDRMETEHQILVDQARRLADG